MYYIRYIDIKDMKTWVINTDVVIALNLQSKWSVQIPYLLGLTTMQFLTKILRSTLSKFYKLPLPCHEIIHYRIIITMRANAAVIIELDFFASEFEILVKCRCHHQPLFWLIQYLVSTVLLIIPSLFFSK